MTAGEAPRTRLLRFVERMRSGLLVEEVVGLEDDQFVQDIEALLSAAPPEPPRPHMRQSGNGCVTCPRRWSEHTEAERSAAPPEPPRPEQTREYRLGYKRGYEAAKKEHPRSMLRSAASSGQPLDVEWAKAAAYNGPVWRAATLEVLTEHVALTPISVRDVARLSKIAQRITARLSFVVADCLDEAARLASSEHREAPSGYEGEESK